MRGSASTTSRGCGSRLARGPGGVIRAAGDTRGRTTALPGGAAHGSPGARRGPRARITRCRCRVSPYLTTEEARVYLRFGSTAGIRTLVLRGELRPAGRGPRRSWLFTTNELDDF